MEKKQYELCLEVLRRFAKVGLLKELVLIGSWCIYFYEDYFASVPYIDHVSLKTRDLDFLIPNPRQIKVKVDIPDLLSDLGFIADFKGSEGYIQLNHPDLILEFLIQEKGRGIDGPYPLPKLGLNATALRFLGFLLQDTIEVKVDHIALILPHPANFALHKLIIAQRRSKQEKALKDKAMARGILAALISKSEGAILRETFRSMPKPWQKKIAKHLDAIEDADIINVLQL